MISVFSSRAEHHVTEANFNFYALPFIHPTRKIKEHDFIYMLSGEWEIGQNDEHYPLQNDSLLILNGGETHYGVSPCSKGAKTMYFHASCEYGDSLCKKIEKKDNSFFCFDNLIDASANSHIKKYFQEIVNAKLAGQQKKSDIFLELLLYELSEYQAYTEEKNIAFKIKNIIHSNPEKNLKNQDLAEMVNVSVKTAENKFRSQIGMTIHRYSIRFKTEQAILAFKNYPEMNMKEIAYNLGFYDEYHFSRQFKKVTGLSPTEFKLKNL